MNETLKNLKERRSIRAYKPEQIKDEELNLILEAGTYAPTGMNNQSPVMVVIQDKDLVSKLSKMNAKVMRKDDIDLFYGAPTVVIVLSDKRYPTYLEDGCLVMGNLMNAAHSINIGSCWIHRAKEVFDSKEGKELLSSFGLSDNYVGIGHCILGYVDGDYPTTKPRKEEYIIRV